MRIIRNSLLILLFSSWALLAVVKAPVSSSPFIVWIPSGSALAFQNSGNEYVLLTVTSGAINSSVGRLTISRDSGQFQFTANESCIFTVTYNVSSAGVSGIANSRRLPNGASVSVLANNPVNLYWNIDFGPILPVMFLLGMIGLCSMVGGGLYSAHKIHKKEYYEGGRAGLLYITIGFGLFMAWVFLGA